MCKPESFITRIKTLITGKQKQLYINNLLTSNKKGWVDLKAEGHLKKAKKIEKSAEKLDPEADSELIIEGLYGAAHHYIAYALQTMHDEHSDKHSQDPVFLKKYGYHDIRSKFEVLDSLRAGNFYGSRTNGERIRKAKQLLIEIKEWGVAEL